MKLATLKDGTRDGTLVVVSRDLRRAAPASAVAPCLRAALEDWADSEGALRALYARLEAGGASDAFDFDSARAAAPLPRSAQWLDGSTFPNHGRLMVRAFNITVSEPQPRLPLVYQGASDDFLGPHDDVPLPSETDEIDFEGELGVVLNEVPMGTPAADAAAHVKLLVLLNDWSLRAVGPREIAGGFGFLQAKPSTSFAPVAVTPDEIGGLWRDGRAHLSVRVHWNGNVFGQPNAGEMGHTFCDLIQHVARTRRLRASTIVGSGTISNAAPDAGSACITERRAIEMIADGVPTTPYMRFGDRVRIEAFDERGASVFGAIDQRVVRG